MNVDVIVFLWIYSILSIFAGLKQYQTDYELTPLTIFAFFLSPIWIFVALIRQFIIRDWE